MTDQIEFSRILNQVAGFAKTPRAKGRILSRKPSSSYQKVTQLLEETEQAKSLIEQGLHLPFVGSDRIEVLLAKAEKGQILLAP